jgi:long-subunit fatty acid transport protein
MAGVGRNRIRVFVKNFKTISIKGACVLSAVLITGAASSAWASPFEVYGASARGISLGNAVTADADGADAIYYNVGALTRARSGVSVGLMLGMDNARIQLNQRPEGYDIPDIGSDTPTVPSDETLTERADTPALGTFSTVTLGGVTSLGTENFRVGMLASFPVAGVGGTQTHFSDERERLFSNQLRYELIGARARRFDIEAGMAYRILGRVSVGVGAHLQPSVKLVNQVYLENATDQEVVQINMDMKQGFSGALTGGLLVDITDYLRAGISVRQNLAFEIEGQNAIQIRGLNRSQQDYPVIQDIGWRPTSSPSTFTLGGATDVGRTTVMIDIRYAVWSAWRDTQGDATEFEDTITPRLGVEYRYSENTAVRFGGSYEPSPVPEQTGRSNFVDNTRLIGSFGATHTFRVIGREFELVWYLQAQGLLSRTTTKSSRTAYPVCAPGVTELCDEVSDELSDTRTGLPIAGVQGLQTGNPGFPGFASGGWLGALGIELRWNL